MMIPEFLKCKINITNDANECWEWNGLIDELGYGLIQHEGNSRKAHRVIFKYCVDKDISGFVIRHKCDNPRCCNPNHLEKGSHNDNVQDRVKRGRSAIGINNGRAKLTEDQVIAIFKDKINTASYLGAKYAVDPKAIRQIRNREKWLTVTDKLVSI